MVASLQTSARAWNMVEVNMENVVRTREAAREAFREREGIDLTFMPFVARAVCDALTRVPRRERGAARRPARPSSTT